MTQSRRQDRRPNPERDNAIAAAIADGCIPNMPTVIEPWADAWDRDASGTRRELEALGEARALNRALAASGLPATTGRDQAARCSVASSAPARPVSDAEATRDRIIAAAVSAGRITAAEVPSYRARWGRDPAGTRRLLEASAADGGLTARRPSAEQARAGLVPGSPQGRGFAFGKAAR